MTKIVANTKSILIFAMAATLLASPMQAFATVADEDVKPVMINAVDKVIVPGYDAFKAASDGMNAAMNKLCAENSAVSYDASVKSFNELVNTWSKIEILRDGPALEGNRFERILFFPDRKGLGLRQIQALLAAKDEGAITKEAMASKSIAIQGLTALEFVLFGTGHEELSAAKDNFRCHAGRAIAGNIAMLAGQLDDAWRAPNGIARDWKEPGPKNPLYRNGEEALIGVLGVLVRGVETTSEKRVRSFYAEDGKLADAHKALYWRSNQVMASVAANLEGMQALWEQSGMQGIIKGDGTAITTNINFDFKTAIQTAKRLDMPVEQILADEKLRSKVEFLIITMADLQARLNNDYGRAMGLAAGFTFSDGD
jgi:uncharacterized protein